eukprot:TRINITY_DN18780_c0_g1_i1.p2 TRINITY_DN18780_c0_g1~~TRINITY_DN18780_c0_g1_i1.p2  ORF type:complete len:227 (+),score=48.77 TRINITY_DN18780_c0_g1_i1:144-824(+)
MVDLRANALSVMPQLLATPRMHAEQLRTTTPGPPMVPVMLATPRLHGERLSVTTPRDRQRLHQLRKRPQCQVLDAVRRSGSQTGDAMFWQSYPSAYADTKAKARRQLEWLYTEADSNGDQRMTLNEFSRCLMRPEAKTALADFGVQLHMGYLVYNYLDKSGKKALTLHDFVDGIMDFFDEHYGTGVDVDKAKLHDLVETRRRRAILREKHHRGVGPKAGAKLPAVR